MKIVHFSDTHLGYNDLDILNAQNINQREADFYDSFSQVVEQIKLIKPDYIIHTGDLFHRFNPSNRAIIFALEQFKMIDSLNIPFILIAGNHSTPRSNLVSPILKIFENFKNVWVSYNQKYQKVEFDSVIFHTMPHMHDDSIALSQIEVCEANIDDSKKNIMMMHCSVAKHYLMQEFGEWVYPKDKEYLFDKMDYVALGHWHGFGQVAKYSNVYYSGSTERTSLGDKRNSKGFALIWLEEKLKVEYKEIRIRPIVVKEIDCEAYESSLENINTDDTLNAIVEVKLKNLTRLQSLDIQNFEIQKHFKNAMSVSVKREFKQDVNLNNLDDTQPLSLERYFLDHLKANSHETEYKRLERKVQELFGNYEENVNDTY